VINGKECNVSQPMVGTPGDWIVPSGCNISEAYVNMSKVYSYQAPLEAIPAGSMVTLSINNVRNPLRFINCAGWFDVQVQEMSASGWSISQRQLRSCPGIPSRGLLRNVQAFLSNTKTGNQLA
jgi:hypothetical protein